MDGHVHACHMDEWMVEQMIDTWMHRYWLARWTDACLHAGEMNR